MLRHKPIRSFWTLISSSQCADRLISLTTFNKCSLCGQCLDGAATTVQHPSTGTGGTQQGIGRHDVYLKKILHDMGLDM